MIFDESTSIPEGWESVSLGDVIELKYGKSLIKSSRDGGKYSVYGSNGIVGLHSDFIIDKPCLVVGRKGSIGEVHLSEYPCWAIDTTYYIDELYEQPFSFWFHRLKALPLAQLNRASAIPGLNREDAYKLPITLPPLNEQRRIVAKIEALKARSQQVKEALEAIPPLLDQFRQSVLAAAFRGDLTADWREKNPDVEPTLELLKRTASQLNNNFDAEVKQLNECKQFIPNTWAWTPLDLVVKNIQAGKNFSCPEVPVTEDTVGLLKISAVTWGFFDERETKTVLDQTKVNSSLFIQKGDFLISRANTIELVGASVIVDEIKYRIMLSDKVWRVNFLEVESKYINFYLKSKSGRKEIESKATGNQLSMRNISQSAFREIVIALPSQEEQKEIVRRMEFLFKSADKIEQQYREVKAHLELLDQSILAKAFRGELVPQDPNDEPASVLLERIQAERAKQEAAAKAAKKSTGKTTEQRSRKAKQQDSESTQLGLPGLE